jgi:hypothetical protein
MLGGGASSLEVNATEDDERDRRSGREDASFLPLLRQALSPPVRASIIAIAITVGSCSLALG